MKYSNVIQVSVYLFSYKRDEYFIDNLHLVGMPTCIKIWGYNSLFFGQIYTDSVIFSVDIQHVILYE